MDFDSLNNFISDYLINDKTKSAIMISSPWGTGKSYYIRESLVCFISEHKDKEIKNYKTIIISLYGIDSIADLSRAIYMEVRLGESQNGSEGKMISLTIGKAILNAATSKMGLNVSENDLQKIYKSLNLKNVLLVLEDIERSKIDIFDILGFVNNLTENEGAKIILVSNEESLIRYNEIIIENPSKDSDIFSDDVITKKELTDESKEYLKVKEKTISDTIMLQNDYRKAIECIIKEFNNDKLNMYISQEDLTKVLDLMKYRSCYNLRTFVFACQKISKIFSQIDDEYDRDFYDCIFYGTMSYIISLKNGEITKWDSDGSLSIKLGFIKYPLFKFCYDYINNYSFDKSLVKDTYEERKKQLLNSKYKSADDPVIKTLVNFRIHSEKEIKEALKKVEKKLDNIDDISFFDYTKIACISIVVADIIGVDITSIKNKMIENIKHLDQEVFDYEIFDTSTPISSKYLNQKVIEEFEGFMLDLKRSFRNKSIIDFDYEPESIELFYKKIVDTRENFLNRKMFISMFDIDKLCETISRCNSYQIDVFIKILGVMYGFSNVADFLSDDLKKIQEFKNILKTNKSRYYKNYDKIQELQYENLVDYLVEIETKLTK